MIKKVLIGMGIAGASILVIRAIMHGNHKTNECRQKYNTFKPTMTSVDKPSKKSVEPTVGKKKYKPSNNDEALLRKCNQLLKSLWKSGNPDNKLYFDDEIYFDIKQCPFPPFITKSKVD